MKVTVTYQIALARGIFGPRRSDVCDLEYLYYAPFCRVFISGDRLHQSLWKAAHRGIVLHGRRVQGD